MVNARPAAFFLALSCLEAHAAAAAPAQLLDKTVLVSWEHEIAATRMDGTPYNVHRSEARQIYVSTAGRLFVRYSAQVRQRKVTREHAPGDNTQPEGKSEAKFEGNRLVLTRERVRGASRLMVDFGPGFTNCTMRHIQAREGGAQMLVAGLNGETYKLVSDTITSSSCEVRDGNLFAGQ